VSSLIAPLRVEDESEAEAVVGLLDLGRLNAWGWDSQAQVLTLTADQPLLGYRRCAVAGCPREVCAKRRICSGCLPLWRASGLPLDDFLAVPTTRCEAGEDRLCLVCRTPGYERVARRWGLCVACDNERQWQGQTVAAFVGDGEGELPPAQPRPTFGACKVVACHRLAVGERGLCQAQVRRWFVEGRPGVEEFCRAATPLVGDRSGRIILTGLPPLVQAEVLFGLQAAAEAGRRWPPSRYRVVVDALRRSGASSIRRLDMQTVPAGSHRFIRQTIAALDFATKTPETERFEDVWDLRVWGMTGFLRFAGDRADGRRDRVPAPAIQQAWLRQTAKEWAFVTLSRLRRGSGARVVLRAVGSWSEHLRRRSDGGEEAAALGKDDICAYLAYLGQQEQAGRIGHAARHAVVRSLRRFLLDVREGGLVRPGRPAAGLHDDVAIHRSEVPRRRGPHREDEVGEAIPEAVVAQLLEVRNLERLAPEPRRRFLIGLATGRRPSELCALRWDCLDYDDRIDEASGETTRAPVLVHDMPKVGKVGFRLPIDLETARLVADQQALVLERYPDTDRKRLRLFPAPNLNPQGDKPYDAQKLATELRAWVRSLSLLEGWLTPDRQLVAVRDLNGNPVAFEGTRIHPYALRHTFAQLRVQAGVAVHELAALLGHDNIRTTQAYYRITATMKRAAMERVAPLQLSANGAALIIVGEISTSDVLRYAVGQVAVPLGVCVEPSNVAAHGQGCPFRHRCFGCQHFRTDPSYLPELRSHLTNLLADRERLAAVLPDLADWARRDALPSDEEIEAVRRLITRCEELLEELDPEDRPLIERAIADLREARRTIDTSFPIELRRLAAQPRPTVFPRAALEGAS
jgi:integrase